MRTGSVHGEHREEDHAEDEEHAQHREEREAQAAVAVVERVHAEDKDGWPERSVSPSKCGPVGGAYMRPFRT